MSLSNDGDEEDKGDEEDVKKNVKTPWGAEQRE